MRRMNREPAQTLEGKKKAEWTRVFVAFIVTFSMVSMAFMNFRYDSLSRYPYRDQKSRELIREYLSKSEIDYIIEYSIAPNVFISFIKEDGFNIYHAAEYKKLSEYEWEQKPANIVKMVEETRSVMDTDTLIRYLNAYSYEELHDWLTHGDTYASGSTLVEAANSLDAYLDDSHTVGIRKPQSLQVLNADLPAESGREILVDASVQQPLEDLCASVTTDLGSSRACAGLVITDGYISYIDQEHLYQQAVAQYGEQNAVTYVSYPGHDEHQLGLAVDFSVTGILKDSFSRTEQSQWLMQNAWKFGFVNTWNDRDVSITNKLSQAYHYRYVGVELAAKLHDTSMTFAESKQNQ